MSDAPYPTAADLAGDDFIQPRHHPGVRAFAARQLARARGEWVIEPNVACVVCPACAFTFDACHVDDATGDYSCPDCGHGADQ